MKESDSVQTWWYIWVQSLARYWYTIIFYDNHICIHFLSKVDHIDLSFFFVVVKIDWQYDKIDLKTIRMTYIIQNLSLAFSFIQKNLAYPIFWVKFTLTYHQDLYSFLHNKRKWRGRRGHKDVLDIRFSKAYKLF